MLIAIIQDGAVANHGDHTELFPNTSFPRSGPSDAWMERNGVVRISSPDFDPQTQTLSKLETPVLIDGKVYKTEVVDLTSEEITANALYEMDRIARGIDYTGFWKQLVRSEAYGTLKAAAKVSLEANVLATELISVFSDAKSDNLDAEVMQVSITEVFSATVLTDEQKTALTGLLDTYNFNACYTY